MSKNDIKKLIRSLRIEAIKLKKQYNNNNIHIEISLESTTGEIMGVNPFVIDLRKGTFFGRDLIDGEYKTVRFW